MNSDRRSRATKLATKKPQRSRKGTKVSYGVAPLTFLVEMRKRGRLTTKPAVRDHGPAPLAAMTTGVAVVACFAPWTIVAPLATITCIRNKIWPPVDAECEPPPTDLLNTAKNYLT